MKPIESLGKFNGLSLDHNKISDIDPLKNLTNLKNLLLGGNNLTES